MARESSLSGRTVIIGVTGGIAAYKAAELVRWFKKRGAAVVVILTPAARRFVSPLTFETLSANPVVTSLWRPAKGLQLGDRPPGRKSPVEHIEIADAADLVVVAPATADFLARASLGLADDALTSTLLATHAPIVLAPAMNVNMWTHPATQEHLERLQSRGVEIVEPEEGELACNWEGKGRLAGIEQIGERALARLEERGRFAGKRIVVTAGPTREALDPVRYLSNHSSGKMGIGIAEVARDRGADVTLVLGPVAGALPGGVSIINVESAEEMQQAVHQAARRAHAIVMAAAVADYRPAKVSKQKLAREGDGMQLDLESTPDILKGVPRRKGRIIVGFALETGDGKSRAKKKLKEKNCDLIVLNDPTRTDSAFGGDTNRVTILDARGRSEELPTLTKREVAGRIWDRVERLWNGRKPR